MNHYAYRALRSDGAVESGLVHAAGEGAASAELSSRGLVPLELRVEARQEERRAAMPIADLALGLRMLADLLDAGLPISRTLQAFEELAPPGWRPALPHIRQSVKEGKSLAAALGSAPVEIPALVVGIAQAGEAGSGIGTAIRRAADAMEGAAATRAAVRAALVYPMVLAAAGLGSVGILVGVVLPKFTLLLADLNHALPPATRFLLSTVATARAGFVPFIFALAVALVVWTAWVATARGRVRWHEWLLSVPILGAARRSSATARVAYSLAALLDSGVPISDAMRHAARAAGDAALEQRILGARDGIASGATISGALETSGAVSSTVVRLVRAGEETGRLTGMLAHAAKLEHERAERVVKSSVRLVEPALVLTFAGIVALVAAELLQAVYSVRQA
jgi:general secretion pathway protein F